LQGRGWVIIQRYEEVRAAPLAGNALRVRDYQK
jgi:hypothetical protein